MKKESEREQIERKIFNVKRKKSSSESCYCCCWRRNWNEKIVIYFSYSFSFDFAACKGNKLYFSSYFCFVFWKFSRAINWCTPGVEHKFWLNIYEDCFVVCAWTSKVIFKQIQTHTHTQWNRNKRRGLFFLLTFIILKFSDRLI